MDVNKWFSKLESEVLTLMSAPAEQIFTESFMVQHTRFENIYEFVNNYKFCSEENLELIDEFVVRNTDFSTWESMQEMAIRYKMNEEGPGEDNKH